MRAEGKRYICDRCNFTAFFKKLGVESLSGGYEVYDKYKKAEGWGCVDGKDLCPACADELKRMTESFFRRVEADNEPERR